MGRQHGQTPFCKVPCGPVTTPLVTLLWPVLKSQSPAMQVPTLVLRIKALRTLLSWASCKAT